ncbi:hypothetical protein WJX81_007366 [Elliptochloris bilobata]|uniref:Uncharacterized protein n=1 Tax=Elliptochloris bilobata TaxID=381761 RepID=A0AAW1QJU4_9CHLO
MVRWDKRVSARLLHPDGTPYPEVEDDEGVQIFLALPGAEFRIQASVERGRFKLPHALLASTLVDGRSLGYRGVLTDHVPSFTFAGWLIPTPKENSSVRAFVFAKPQVPCEVKPGQLRFPEAHAAAAKPAPTVGKLPEGEKIFNVPSLVADIGAPVQSSGDWSKGLADPFTWVPGRDVAEVTLRFELPSTLLARGLLDVTDPQRPPPDPLLEVCCDLTLEEDEPAWSVRSKKPEEVT